MTLKETTRFEAILLAVLLAIISIRSDIPSVIFYSLLFILVIPISFLPIFMVLRPSVSNFIKFRRLKKKESLIIRENVPKFKEFIDRYIELIQKKGYDNISYLLEEIKHRSGIKEFQEIPFPNATDFIELTNDFRKTLGTLNLDRNSFKNASEVFVRIIEMYNEYCVCKPIDKIKKIDKKVDDEMK